MDEEKNIYEDNIVDIDEIDGTDVKINPDFYIHQALLKAQVALTKDNVSEGFLQFRILIEHIESLCEAAKLLPKDYKDIITKFSNEDEQYKKTKDEIKPIVMANFKLKELLKNVFNKKVSTQPLKL